MKKITNTEMMSSQELEENLMKQEPKQNEEEEQETGTSKKTWNHSENKKTKNNQTINNNKVQDLENRIQKINDRITTELSSFREKRQSLIRQVKRINDDATEVANLTKEDITDIKDALINMPDIDDDWNMDLDKAIYNNTIAIDIIGALKNLVQQRQREIIKLMQILSGIKVSTQNINNFMHTQQTKIYELIEMLNAPDIGEDAS